MNPPAAIIDAVESYIAARGDGMALPREGARFCHALVHAIRPALVVEIGTGYGYSGLWLATALKSWGGKLVTIDRDERKAEVARKFFAEAGVAELVDIRIGVAGDVLRSLRQPVGFVLNDADKERCREYVELLLPRMSSGATIVTDNTRTHAGQLADFLDWIRAHDSFVSADVPVGNGMEISVRV